MHIVSIREFRANQSAVLKRSLQENLFSLIQD